MITPFGDNLVFLLSTPRAGSTLLSVLLNRLPGVLCPPEPWFLLRLLALNGPGNPDATFNDEVARLGTCEFFGSTLPQEPIRAFAVSAYNEKLLAAGKSRFVDKTPRYFHILSEIQALFPHARFIWLQRNPLDVVASYKTTWNLSAEVLFNAPARPESLDFVYGLDTFREFFAHKGKYRLIVRYEDLVADPATAMGRVQEFLGVKPTDPFDGKIDRAMLSTFNTSKVGDPNVHKTRRVHTQSVDRWRSVLTQTEVRLVLSTMGTAIFREMGYGDAVDEALAGGWTQPSEATALRQRIALRAHLPSRLAVLTAELRRQERNSDEQAAFCAILAKERDRLSAEVSAAQQEAKRAVKDAQQHIDALKAQLDGTVAEHAGTVESLKSQLARMVVEHQQHIDALKAQLGRTVAEHAGTVESLKSQLARMVVEHQQTIDAQRSQVNQLAATAHQQSEYTAILNQERLRLEALVKSRDKECEHYVKVIDEQTAYIRLLEQQRNQDRPSLDA